MANGRVNLRMISHRVDGTNYPNRTLMQYNSCIGRKKAPEFQYLIKYVNPVHFAVML